MKKIKSGLCVIALVFGISGALISKNYSAARLTDQTYSWTAPLGNFVGTIAQAQAYYGCGGHTILCATGTAPGKPNAYLYYD
jgi:hypothetical protein